MKDNVYLCFKFIFGQFKLIFKLKFNPRTSGGGGGDQLRFFADSEKTAVLSAAKFAIAVQ